MVHSYRCALRQKGGEVPLKIKALTKWREGCLNQGDVITEEGMKCVLNALHPYKVKRDLVQMFSPAKEQYHTFVRINRSPYWLYEGLRPHKK